MPKEPRLTKDQQRAHDAYQLVAKVKFDERDEYEIAVKRLGANVLRSGLCAALADLMRRGSKASTVLAHLASFKIPGLLPEDEGENLLQKANNLDVSRYMLATRETLQAVMWLKRACEALFVKPDAPKEGERPDA
jgi:CRISPR type III-B/RAMP module-associated protein Cmr5